MDRTYKRSKVEPYLNLGPDADPADRAANVAPTPGQQAVVLAALFIGLLLLGIQLWFLTVALDRYLSGAGQDIWPLPVLSGAIFVGGLLALRMIGHHRPPLG